MKQVRKAKSKSKAKAKARKMPLNLLEVGKVNFNSTIRRDGIVLLYVWGQHCGPCKAIAPVYEQVARRTRNKGVVFGKVDAGAEFEVAAHLGVRQVPKLVVFYYGIQMLVTTMSADPERLQAIINEVAMLDIKPIRDSATLPEGV